jgi:two-component system, OmpR family, sensor kinase
LSFKDACMKTPWSDRLYLRIWLAVVAGVALLMLMVGLAWRAAMEHTMAQMPVREWVLRDANGEVLASTTARLRAGQPVPLQVLQPDGTPLQMYLERRMDRSAGGERAEQSRAAPAGQHPKAWQPWWVRLPFGFFGALALMGLAAALALYPVVRRLTRRLQDLQQGVQRWGEGDLSVRVPEFGDDEVADLSRRFNAAAERIGQLVQAQKSLLANASHELRSPLARIRMGLELLDSPQALPAVRERSRCEILRNMAELDQLIEEILLASRLDAREVDIGPFEAVDLVGLCAEECARVGARLEVPEGVHSLPVQGVARLLRRMVRNLLENAQRYGGAAEDAQAVVLCLGGQGGGELLRVCDRGPGVPVAYRERIFEPFFRLPGASERTGGVGLGLSLVLAIAGRHGWRAFCEERPGGGACFVVARGP